MDDDPMDARFDEEEWDEPTVTPLKERDNAVGTEKFDGETVKFFTHRRTAKFKTTSNGKNFNQHADEIGKATSSHDQISSLFEKEIGDDF